MKSKRRTVNTDSNIGTKKIRTRNMISKMSENKISSEHSICHNSLSNKPSLNTRAKSSTIGKSLDFDPYLFSKNDEECKSPTKKMKMTEKSCKDISINTCDFTSMTDPIFLGPCEPGTSIELRGIVWLETATGLLVINVTWRGRTYVGTLLDSSKYEFTPTFTTQDNPVKFENSPPSRANRGRKRYAPTTTSYSSCSKSSGTIRHSRRLSESISYLNNNKKSSCYIDSVSVSAEHSVSGESDSDQKSLSVNKTRSVTRSLAKQTKTITDDSELTGSQIDDFSNFVNCSQTNCFKRFIDNTALSYHMNRSHGIIDEVVKEEKVENQNNETEKNTKINGLKLKTEKINGKIENYDEVEESEESSLVIVDDIALKSENKLLELSISLPKLLPESSKNESTIDDQHMVSTCLDAIHTQPVVAELITGPTTTSADTCTSLTNVTTLASGIVRTVSATTVYIPFEVSSQVSCGVSSNSILSPASIHSKPPSQASQLKKAKPTKLSLQVDTYGTSFQIPTTSVLPKKRPLIPMYVSNQTRPISSPAVSPNQSISVSRSPIFSNVTPILPATCTTSQTISTISSGSVNNQINTKRVITTSNNLSPPAMTSLLSLKPIQPKPKSSSILPTYSHPTTSTFVNPGPMLTVPGISPNQTSFQRQILPNPITKMENCNPSDDRPIQKFDTIPSSVPMKKKRRKSDKKLRLNFHECNKFKRLSLNHIQPKLGDDLITLPGVYSSELSLESYKIDEENSHSPEYSDLSEANDTPAPILEKEIELKSTDSDKLVICTDFEITSNRMIGPGSENYDENKDNKPPSLIPAVLSVDILNGSTHETELLQSPSSTGRKKPQNQRKSSKVSKQETLSTALTQSSLKCNIAITSSRKSFHSSGVEDKTPASPSSSSKLSLYNSINSNQTSKGKMPGKCSNLSAINDYVWMTKHSNNVKSKVSNNDNNSTSLSSKVSSNYDCVKNSETLAQSKPTNGKFSVQALTSTQEIVSRSFPNSTTVISVNPSTQLTTTSTLFRN